jgi:D-sedoheptulose 7-phosphate isomerase
VSDSQPSPDFVEAFLDQVAETARRLDRHAIEAMAACLERVRGNGGRVFVLGVGGSAANASHLVNDLRKLATVEAYAPTDNAAELTARANDEGWDTVFTAWLAGSRLAPDDAVLVLSVGGGSWEPPISTPLARAVDYAVAVGASVLGIVGRDGGHTARHAEVCVRIPTVDPERVTPLTEAFQAVVWHLLVTHPRLRQRRGRWEDASRSR